MNIWIFNHYAITPDLPGGTRHFDFGKELVKRGYKVTIFASSFNHSLLKEVKKHEKNDFLIEDYEGVRFIWIKTFPYCKNDWRRVVNMLSYSFRAYKIAKKLNIEKPDVIIGSSVHLFAVYTAYLLAKHYKVPFVMEVRDLWPLTLIDTGISKYNPFVIFLGILEKYLYKKAHKIITLLPKANKYIESLGISNDKIVWISNGVDLERFNIISSKNIKKETFIVGYIGTIGSKTDNLEIVIKVAKKLKDIYHNIFFEFVGSGPGKNELIKVTQLEKLNNVIFKDPVEKSKVPEILDKIDVLFLSTKGLNLFKYGLSYNKLFDYLASGKPIIFASNSINNPIEEAGTGLTVPPEDPKAVAEAIIKLYNMSEEERDQMGRNGRNYVEKYYSISVLVDKLEKVIEEVCNEKPFN